MRSRRRYIRYGLLTANLVLLVAVVAFVSQKPTSSASNALLNQADETTVTSPLDQLSSADIAVHVSQLVKMDEDEVFQAIQNADSEKAELAVVPADNVVVAKPQVVETNTKTAKDIKRYTAVAGDTVSSVADKFNVSPDSIKWSNNLTSNIIPAGRTLFIPPVEGIVYVVKSGDTAENLAAKFSASKAGIIRDNDAEVGGLRVGQRILIAGGRQQITTGTSSAARIIAYSYYGGGGNTYVRGYCTWYAAERAGAPNGWGNANTWDNRAPLSGWRVSTTPRVGAIAQTDSGGLGHVGVVDAVSADGTMIKYSDMNGLAGFGRVGSTKDWVPAHGHFQRFIYR